ncbi:unnamed protein product [Phytomonas sp. Hart1]|nr:unnamed protein product [Phytomonas sp. Hart1]|eukprot:CCW70465.1 unnamed protein product [Phytomonas sp. isolate Hart1]
MLSPTQWCPFLGLNQSLKLPSCVPRFVRRPSYLFPLNSASKHEVRGLRKRHKLKTKDTNSETSPCNNLPLSSWIFRVRMLSNALREDEFHRTLLLFPQDDIFEFFQNEVTSNGMCEWVDIPNALHQLARIPKLLLLSPLIEQHGSPKLSEAIATSQSFSMTNTNTANVCECSNSLVRKNDLEISTVTKTSSGTSLSSHHVSLMRDRWNILALQKEFMFQVLMYVQKMKCVYRLNKALESTISLCSSETTVEACSMREISIYHLPCSSNEHGETHWPYTREEASVVIELITWHKERESMNLLALLYGQVHSQEISRQRHFVRWLSTEFEASLNALPPAASLGNVKHTCLLWLVNRIVYLDSRDNLKSNSSWITHDESPQKWLDMCADCVCAATWDDLFTADIIRLRSKNQNLTPHASMKGVDTMNTPHASPFTDFASLFNSLSDSTSELSITIDTESLTKSPIDSEEDLFWREAVNTFKYDTSVHAVLEVLRRRFVASDLPICPSLRVYWRCVLSEILKSGWEAIEVLTDTSYRYKRKKNQSSHLQISQYSLKLRKNAEYYSVGVFLSFRRILSAFSKHQLLKPLIELHDLVTGYHCHTVDKESKITFEVTEREQRDTTLHTPNTSNVSIKSKKLRHLKDHAAAVRQDILSGKITSPLLWRELVLFDAFTLINLGHTSEKASDMWDAVREFEDINVVTTASLSVVNKGDRIGEKGVKPKPLKSRVHKLQQRIVYLQEECLKHLVVLEATSNNANASLLSSKRCQCITSVNGMDFILSKITPKARAGMISRLKEGLRLSTKVLLGLGDTASICALYKNYGSLIGGCWEAGKALVQEGAYDTALDAFQQLLRDTHGQYPSGVPRFIQDMILEAITGVSRGIVSVPDNEQQREMDMVNMLMQRYEQLLSLSEGQLLPGPVCLHALLKGILKGTSSAVTATPLRCAHIGICFIKEYLTRYGARVGLLSRSIDTLIESVLEVRQATASDIALFETVEQDFLRALVEILRVFPHLPITCISLTWFLREGYRKGVLVVLCSLITPKALDPVDESDLLLSHERDILPMSSSSAQSYLSDSYIQATLNSLSPKILKELIEFLAISDITFSQTDFLNFYYKGMSKFEEARFTRLKDMCTTSAEYRVRLQHQQRPWQCFLCRTWNSRYSTMCKLCKSLDTAVVQCARCGGFASTRDTACNVCEADFGVDSVIMTSKETADSESSNGPFAMIGDGRSSDVFLHSNAFKAVFPLRTWTCQDCNYTNDAKHIFYCAFCNSQNSALQKTLTETSYMCPTCGRINPQGLLRPWCSTCGTLSPVIPNDKKKAFWYCLACHHLNPWLLVHCERCTEGRPVPALVPDCAMHLSSLSTNGDNTSLTLAPSPFIMVPWDTVRCHSCRVINPLVAKFCHGCGSALTFPSEVRKTIHSGFMGWMRGVFVLDPNHRSCDKDECQLPVERKTRAPTAADQITCSYCGCSHTIPMCTAFYNQFVCKHCHACLPGFTAKLWVCLQSKCFHVNVEWDANTLALSKGLDRDTMGDESLKSKTKESKFYVCSACHISHDSVNMFQICLQSSAIVPHLHPHPHSSLSPASSFIPKGESDVSNPLGYCCELSRMRTVTALCFPPVSGPTKHCSRCGTYLEYTNLACVCHQCGLCQSNFVHEANQRERGRHDGDLLSNISPTRTILSGWLILFKLSKAVKSILCYLDSDEKTESGGSDKQKSDQLNKEYFSRDDPTWILGFFNSAVSVLRSTQEDLLPWRSCDLQNRMHCGVEPRVVVLDDEMESVHTAILLVRYIISDLCLVAKSFSRNKGMEPSVILGFLESDTVWEKQRQWLLVAGDLVDIVNTTTDFDEIGFSVLAKLCQLIRPHELEHIQSETRWTYLHAMKLTREAMIHEVVCMRCFGRHKKDEQCCC